MKIILPFLLILASLMPGSSIARVPDPDVKSYPECRFCGMYRDHFRHSRMLITHGDGVTVATCSIHCAAVDYVREVDGQPIAMMVGDFHSGELIDAEKAVWVIGGDKPGVMSERAKWAFRNKLDALRFIRKHGGRVSTFEGAMRASYIDLYEENRN